MKHEFVWVLLGWNLLLNPTKEWNQIFLWFLLFERFGLWFIGLLIFTKVGPDFQLLVNARLTACSDGEIGMFCKGVRRFLRLIYLDDRFYYSDLKDEKKKFCSFLKWMFLKVFAELVVGICSFRALLKSSSTLLGASLEWLGVLVWCFRYTIIWIWQERLLLKGSSFGIWECSGIA